MAYCEQVGKYRQDGPNQGDITNWYNFIIAIKGKLRIRSIIFISYFF
jgi:hypothetical protein